MREEREKISQTAHNMSSFSTHSPPPGNVSIDISSNHTVSAPTTTITHNTNTKSNAKIPPISSHPVMSTELGSLGITAMKQKQGNVAAAADTAEATTASKSSHPTSSHRKNQDIRIMKDILISNILQYRQYRLQHLQKSQLFVEEMRRLREAVERKKQLYWMYKNRRDYYEFFDDGEEDSRDFVDSSNAEEELVPSSNGTTAGVLDQRLMKSIVTSSAQTNKKRRRRKKKSAKDKKFQSLIEDWIARRNQIQRFKEEIQDVQKQISETKHVYNANCKLLREKIFHNQEAQLRGQKLNSEIKSLTRSITEKRKIILNRQLRCETCKKDIERKEKQLEQLKKDHEESQQQYQHKQTESQKLKSQLQQKAQELMIQKLRLEAINMRRKEFTVQKLNKIRKPIGKLIFDRTPMRGESSRPHNAEPREGVLTLTIQMPQKTLRIPISEIEDIEPLLDSNNKVRILFHSAKRNRYNIFICDKRDTLVETMKSWIKLNAKLEDAARRAAQDDGVQQSKADWIPLSSRSKKAIGRQFDSSYTSTTSSMTGCSSSGGSVTSNGMDG